MIKSLNELVEFCKKKNDIYIYGAGTWAKNLYSYLTGNHIKVSAFIVSKKAEDEELLYSLPIVQISEFKRKDLGYFILVAIKGSSYNKDIMVNIMDNNVHNVYFLNDSIFHTIWLELSKQLFGDSQVYRIEVDCPVEAYHSIFSMVGDNGKPYYWRFRYDTLAGNALVIDDFFKDRNALREFENGYGKYNYLRYMDRVVVPSSAKCSVYMAKCDKDKGLESKCQMPDWITPIQVGAALTDRRICEVADNTGDNISNRNLNYSECSALYWIWKNVKNTDYVGLCHYRRHFEIPDNDIRILSETDADVLATIPTFIPIGTLAFFQAFILASDIQLLVELIKKIYPEYYYVALLFFKSRFYPPCNMMIMKYNIFNDYCKFAFSVTFEIERFYEERGIYRFNRYMGYIMECLFGIYLMKHKDEFKIAYTNMIFYQ